MFDPSTTSPAAAEPFALEFLPPKTVRLGVRQKRVGGIVYRLLDVLFANPHQALPVTELEAEVWGGPVNRNTLWSACRRARNVLTKLHHPLRVAIDGDRVTLV